MTTADIKVKLLELAKQPNFGQPPRKYIEPEFAEALLAQPKGLKRLSKRKLSDNAELRVFGHADADCYVAVAEFADGTLILDTFDDLDVIPAVYKARLPSEYSFALIQSEYGLLIPIAPTWSLDEDADPDDAYFVREEESVWKTTWFDTLFSQHLQTSSEGIFAAKNETTSAAEIISLLEEAGLIYSELLEDEELDNCALPKSAGGLALKQSCDPSFGM